MTKTKMKYKLIDNQSQDASSFGCLRNIIGQTEVVKKLNFFINAQAYGKCFPTVLFSGSHGLGKTFISKKLASALNRRYIEINCSSLRNSNDFFDWALNTLSGDSGATVLFDESHALSNEMTNMLLSILNPSDGMINSYQYGEIHYEFNLNHMNFIFATTDAHEMFPPLKNRCEQIYFHPYEDEAILEMLRLYMKDVQFECDIQELIDTCRSRGRDTFLLAENLNRYLIGNQVYDKVLTDEMWEDFKFIFDVYPKGLKREELNLLKVVNEHGPISCANLALKLMVNQKNVKEELEVRLQEIGLIASSTRGRIITSEGKKYLESLKDVVA